MKWFVFCLVCIHGLIHFMGPAKAFGFAELPQLTQPVSKPMGLAWALAGLLTLATAFTLLRAPAHGWALALVAVAVSQTVILLAWSDAKAGSLANLVMLSWAVHAFAAHGPVSFRAEYARQVARRLATAKPPEVLTEADLQHLPEPVRRYVAQSGALGRPLAGHFHATWRGRIRSTPDTAWMDFSAVQHNFFDEPARFFRMDATRAGLPIDVFHDYHGGHARMRVRLLSLIPLVDAMGPEMDRGESVTLFNDVALFAPWGLADPSIEWEPIDERRARGRYTRGAQPVSAVLHFDDEGQLVDFVSDDRLRALDGGGFVDERWSTPVTDRARFHGLDVVSSGQGRWHPEGGKDFSYVELEMLDHGATP